MSLPENFEEIVKNSWNIIDKYKKYPIANRGLACYFSNELKTHINHFRSKIVKDASITELAECIPIVFSTLKISSEFLQNKPYLCASIAALLGSISYFSHSKNRIVNGLHEQIVEKAESLALWGTGSCQHFTSLLFLLLAATNIRPIDFVCLQSNTGKSGHVLLVIGRNEENLDHLYDSELFVVDYWSGSMGKASELFKEDGPLFLFRDRKIVLSTSLPEGETLPSFCFPNVSMHDFVELFYNRLIEFISHQIKENPTLSSNPESFFTKSKYQKRAKKIDFLGRDSSSCEPEDIYDDTRDKNLAIYYKRMMNTSMEYNG